MCEGRRGERAATDKEQMKHMKQPMVRSAMGKNKTERRGTECEKIYIFIRWSRKASPRYFAETNTVRR